MRVGFCLPAYSLCVGSMPYRRVGAFSVGVMDYRWFCCFLMSNDCKIKAAGDNTSFAFSFIEDFPVYRENPSWNYVVKVIDNNGNCLCQTLVVGKHTI